MSSITPIFVLGSARNGTTWMGNLLCRHPDIAGVQHKVHWGIHESKIRRNELYWGDISSPTAFISFIEQYASADYFQITGARKENYYESRPSDFVSFFFSLMDDFAKRKGANHWTTKIDPAYYHDRRAFSQFIKRVQERYEKCKFISIRRNKIDVLKSYLSMEGVAHQRRSAPGISQLGTILCIARMQVHYQNIESIAPDEDTMHLSFGRFKSRHEESVREIMNHLNLGYNKKLSAQRYPPNSSFEYKQNADDHSADVQLAQNVIIPLFTRSPILAQLILSLRERLRPTRCPLSWRLLKMKFMPDDLRQELEQSGDWGLVENIFGKPGMDEAHT